MIQYLIVCPLVFLAGLVDSIAGGGGLISLPEDMMAADSGAEDENEEMEDFEHEE